MVIKFFNTMSRELENFAPIQPNKVGLYTCGPTVYDFAHIGNFRTYIFEDILRRYLEYRGYNVFHVMNITDVDDKTIRGSIQQNVSLTDYTNRYIEAFFEDIDTLKIQRAHVYPRATDHVPEMLQLINMLQSKGHTYASDGSIYFSIKTHPAYGKLAGIKTSELKIGARVNADEYTKDDPQDFALWKAYSPDDGNVVWDSPFGKGRPGWHLECSAMAMKYLGESFDIHCGGVDNIFPHHQNEIAQSECATGNQFVKYWLHSEHLIVENQKMSKSLGNFYTLRDLLNMSYKPEAIRFLLLSCHYRQKLNFTLNGIDGAWAAIERILDFQHNLTLIDNCSEHNPEVTQFIKSARQRFIDGLDDDLNICESLAGMFDFIKTINIFMAENRLCYHDAQDCLAFLQELDRVLAILPADADVDVALIENLINQRLEARNRKDWKAADDIRDQLKNMGIIIKDRPNGTVWKKR